MAIIHTSKLCITASELFSEPSRSKDFQSFKHLFSTVSSWSRLHRDPSSQKTDPDLPPSILFGGSAGTIRYGNFWSSISWNTTKSLYRL